jgi:hypothetical protein
MAARPIPPGDDGAFVARQRIERDAERTPAPGKPVT